MTEAELELERVKCVMRLGGGELHVPHPDFPDEWEGAFAYWYEGCPEWWTEGRDLSHEMRTAVVWHVPTEPPPGWAQVASFSASGEAECWWCVDNEENPTSECELCEGEALIYLGTMHEVVYRATTEESGE